ncbi:MAG: helix-turn-helix transcriptional regulator [Victivallales bacterium]|nr:helix-turn-helix transcriptional regulator [Victivallales bacterium]
MVISYKNKNWVSPYQDLDIVAGRSFAQSGSMTWQGLHPDAWNLIRVMSGRCRVKNGNEVIDLIPGGFFLLQPASERIFTRNGQWDAYWAMFSLYLPLHWPEIKPGIYRINPPEKESARILRSLLETVSLVRECEGEWHLLANNILENIILRGNRIEQSQDRYTDRRMFLAAKLLKEPDNTMSMDKIAAQCGMSHASFFAEFKRVFKQSPRQFREQARLRQAKVLLETKRLSIEEIAVSVNMIDSSYFTKRFQKHFGMTPTQYRKKLSIMDR